MQNQSDPIELVIEPISKWVIISSTIKKELLLFNKKYILELTIIY